MLFGNAQSNLHVMLSRGTLPAWVNTSPGANLVATKSAKIKMGWKLDGYAVKALEQANEAQYDYLRSGRLLFNDEAGELANKIADRLLENDAPLRNSLNICVYYSSGTNLISFPNGFIVIELGLFAQLENEDQLAFLIAHEIAHVKNGDVATSEEAWQPKSWDDDVEKYVEYLKQRERQADLDGYQLYKIAGYSPLQALRTFDVLERNWLVPQALPFSSVLFTDSLFHYPEYYMAHADSCTLGYGESDFFNTTHDSYASRRSNVAAEYKLDSTKSEVLPMSREFAEVNQLAIYNCGNLSLETQDYPAALYLGYYIYQTDSTQRDDAGMLISKAIYLYAATASSQTENQNTIESESIQRQEKFGDLFFWANNEEPEKDLRGHIAGVKAFYEELSSLERMILAVRWCWNYSQQTVEHTELATELAANSVAIINHVIEEPVDSLDEINLGYRPGKKWRDEEDEEEKEEEFHDSNSDLDEMKRLAELFGKDIQDEIDSLRAARRKRLLAGTKTTAAVVVPESPKGSTQLLSCTKDSAFRLFYTTYMAADSSSDLKDKPNAEHLQADSIYFVGSSHIWCREYKRTNRFRVKDDKTEQNSKQIRKNIQTAGKSSKIKLLSADPLEPDTLTLDDYNQYALARRVFGELLGYEDEKYTYPIAYKEEFDAQVEKTHVTHMISDLAITKQFTKVRQPGWFVFAVIFPYTSPIALIWVAPPRKFTYRQTAIYNLQTGNLDWTWVQTGKGSGGPQQASPYYAKVFKKIKKPKKKTVPAAPAR